ncbi:MAG: PilZ domain-containing protein [Candidatus Omnitrophica bacterium]|nr:PilZ domain-containing protein [Candidatus Omnitrophota bacterium]
MSTAVETTDDRRVFERFSARFPVKFKDAREDYGTDVFLRDASAEGVRILTKERFFLDDQLALEVELPDGGEPMVLSGRVRWVKFLDLSLWDIGVQFPQVKFLKMQRLFKLTENSAL